MEFFGYVFVFWGTWKCYDFCIHCFFPKKPTICNECKGREQKLAELTKLLTELGNKVTPHTMQYEQTVRKAQSEINQLRTEVSRLKKMLPTVLDILNKSSEEKLRDIKGIGKRRTEVILSTRPFETIEEAEQKLGGKTIAVVLRWLDPKVR